MNKLRGVLTDLLPAFLDSKTTFEDLANILEVCTFFDLFDESFWTKAEQNIMQRAEIEPEALN